jgi:hypothetical protein
MDNAAPDTSRQRPAVTPERFAQGMTYDQYKAQMTRNQERFVNNERQVTLEPADLAAWKRLPRPLKVLVLAEDWCGDVIDNLPVLGKLAQESGKADLRIFLRDQNLDIMDQYLNHGEFRSIPVFVFFDDQFRELGRFVERPESVTQRRGKLRQEVFAQHPEIAAGTPMEQLPEEVRRQVMGEMAARREQAKPTDIREVVSELTAIVARAAG